MTAPLKSGVIAALQAGGASDREIAGQVGCDRSYVTMVRNDMGLAPVPPRRGVIDPAYVDAALARGASRGQIGQHFGVTRHAITMHLRRRREKRAGAVIDAGPADPGEPVTPQTEHSTETELVEQHSSQVQF